MTVEPAQVATLFSNDLAHCPQCGGELQSSADELGFECLACEYREQEVAYA